MKLLNPIIDKLQATFPPNRVAILLAGVITAVSGSIAAWLAAHFPGLNFGSVEIAGVLGAAVIITVRLLDRWFDRWQAKEEVDYGDDIQIALDELAGTPYPPSADGAAVALGTLEGVEQMILEIQNRIAGGPADFDRPRLSAELGVILDTITQASDTAGATLRSATDEASPVSAPPE